jgi:cellulose synthase/poly-beta-1,6-N-acetylglucosamine synthase-like glycosyltransferase
LPVVVYGAICILLALFYGVMFLFYQFGWLTLPEFQSKEITGKTKVSILIPARNEEKNIANVLQDILQQTYPAELIQIIVIDDHSADGTIKIAEEQSEKIQVLRLETFLSLHEIIHSHKKKAIEIAVEQASGDLIITTDADCRMKNNWLGSIVSFYEKTNCKMIVAPVSYFHERTIFENLQALDFLGFIGITGACLQFNFANTCNGANLAYEKNAFNEVGGYGSDQLSSGDDMLLMHKIAKRFPKQVHFLKNRNAIVFTYAQRNIADFFRQRIRWTSKTNDYSDKRVTFILYATFIFYVSIFWNAVFSFFDAAFVPVLVFQVVIKMFCDLIFLASVLPFFRRQKLLLLFLPAWAFHILYVLIAGLLVNFFKPKWKERPIT